MDAQSQGSSVRKKMFMNTGGQVVVPPHTEPARNQGAGPLSVRPSAPTEMGWKENH